MVRPYKSGIDYFPIEVYMDQDDKVQMIEAIHGIAGFGLLVRLLMKIYQEGYYYEWTEKEQILFSKKVNVDINDVNAFIDSCIKWEVFNPKIYEKYKILTSRGIQKRFLDAVKRRSTTSLIKEYLLLNAEDMKDFNQIVIVNINEENVNISTQRREEKSREEKSREEYVENAQIILDLYHEYLPMLPKVKKLTPQRISYINKRIDDYSLEEVKEMLIKASKSNFLTGKSKDWKASFDWLMNPSNFLKVLEGNYANKEGSNGQLRRDSTKDIDPAPKWDIEHLIIRAED